MENRDISWLILIANLVTVRSTWVVTNTYLQVCIKVFPGTVNLSRRGGAEHLE